jgi:hypothetical protein
LEALAKPNRYATKRLVRRVAMRKYPSNLLPGQAPIEPEHQKRTVIGAESLSNRTQAIFHIYLKMAIRLWRDDIIDSLGPAKRAYGQAVLGTVRALKSTSGAPRKSVEPRAHRTAPLKVREAGPQVVAGLGKDLTAGSVVAKEAHQEAKDLRTIAIDGRGRSGLHIASLKEHMDLKLVFHLRDQSGWV